jgi:methyl-accepting chemotaxis protein
MTAATLPDIAARAVGAIERVGEQVEHVFAEVGGDLGKAHTMFAELNSGLYSLSEQLSGSKIEGASIAFQDIAARLRRLADALPAETALLGSIGASTAQASALLRQLIQHIHQIGVIARSSRIEAASLEGNRDDFLNFTREASDLAMTVQSSVVACSKEQKQLAAAIADALNGQQEFEKRYRDRLLSVSTELISTFSELKHLQAQGGDVAKLAKAGTLRISDAVGVAIVSLQAGDSTRQRLEHICGGLRKVTDANRSLAPSAAALIGLLQAAQLKDTVCEFEADIDKINGSLARLSADSTGIVAHGHSLYGGKNNDMTSFLVVMKRRLAEASVLIAACGQAKVSVDASIATLEDVLGNFRVAMSALDETVVDITLIGMNAALKAGHLGVKGRAFVVIANELKQTADRISGAAKLLEPVLAQIGQVADRLKSLRSEEESLRIADLERSIAGAVGEIEDGNGRLVDLMEHLTRESVLFETLMTDARKVMSDLGAKFATLPEIAGLLEGANRSPGIIPPDDADEIGALFDELYMRYTMEREREVHLGQSDRFGLRKRPLATLNTPKADAEEVLFF